MSDPRIKFATLLIAVAFLLLSAFDSAVLSALAYVTGDWGTMVATGGAALGKMAVSFGLIDIARDA